MMADETKLAEEYYGKMLASEEAYLAEKKKLEEAEEARQQQKYEEKLRKAKSQAAREAAIADEAIRRQKKALSQLKEQAEADREAFLSVSAGVQEMLSSVADDAEKSFTRIEKAREKLAEKLKGDASQFQEVSVLGGNEFAGDFTVLRDYGREQAALAEYSRLLSQIRERGKEALGTDAGDFFAAFAKMDVARGTEAAEALLRASDERFLQYIADWKQYGSLSENFADSFFQADYEALAAEMKEELAAAFDKVPDSFFEDGRLSARAFGDGFLEEFHRQVAMISQSVAAVLSPDVPGMGAPKTEGNTTYHTEYYLSPSSSSISDQLRAISAAEERNKLRGV